MNNDINYSDFSEDIFWLSKPPQSRPSLTVRHMSVEMSTEKVFNADVMNVLEFKSVER